jgi:hypothetical protein
MRSGSPVLEYPLADALRARYGGPRLWLPPRIAGGAGAAMTVPPSQEGYESVPGIAELEIPFTQASKPVWERGPFWTGLTASAEAQELEPKGIPANGYLRYILLRLVTETEGESEAGQEELADWPWSYLLTLTLEDQGGHKIYGPLSGYNAYLAAKWGRYFERSDAAFWPSFNKGIKTPSCTWAIPVEIAPTGWGALSNQTEQTQYHIAPVISPLSKQYKEGLIKKAPKVKLVSWVCLWPLPQARTEPEPGAEEGRVQQQRPPLLGTVQFWTQQPGISIVSGQNRVVCNRVGQMVRTHILVTRNKSTGQRAAGILGDPLQFDWARVRFRYLELAAVQDDAWSSVVESGKSSGVAGFDTGVYPILYSKGEQRYAGANEANSLLATVNTTALVLEMPNWGEGILEWITNDLAVAAVSETARREVPGQTATREPRMVE